MSAEETPVRETVLPPVNEASVTSEIGERADTVWSRGKGKGPAIAKVASQSVRGQQGRVAIIDGCRTPFCKSGTDLQNLDVIDLAAIPAAEIVTRSDLDPQEIGLSVFGVVVPALHAPNLGREVVFRASLPMTIPGTTVNLACASSNRAITSVAEAILSGQCEVGLAGGSESLSNVPIQYSKNAARRLIEFSKAKSAGKKLGVLSKVRPGDLVPVPPAIAEYTTGMTMGQACEKMAKENDISRRSQDEIALLSHQRAAAAAAEGRLDDQIAATFPKPDYDRAVTRDNGVRADSTLEALAYAALDPGSQLLQGPAYAAPMALDQAGLTLADIDLVEMHEAFAAQIVSNMKAFASLKFAREELGRSAPLGEVDLDRFNVNGGSISIGHPFGATGARVTMQLLFELTRRGLNLGLMTVCAAGGVGFSMVVERE
jgi:acetyl-CoA acyltransferase